MVEATLNVTGMHCPKCDARVEKAVGALPGVQSVKADHESDSVAVSFDGSEDTLRAIKEAITALDFDVK